MNYSTTPRWASAPRQTVMIGAGGTVANLNRPGVIEAAGAEAARARLLAVGTGHPGGVSGEGLKRSANGGGGERMPRP